MKNRVQLKDYIRYQLLQLTQKNGPHVFERLCFELARHRVVTNLLPATGPVQSGGDQGRDFESYQSYLSSTPTGSAAFLAKVSDGIVVGGCTLERNNLPAKVKADLTSMFGSGAKPAHVVYYCQIDLAVAERHKLQKHCQDQYQAQLDIHDGQAIADQLADADTFWIAEQFLDVPADFFPAQPASEDYEKLRERWLVAKAQPSNYADFLEIKLGLRKAMLDRTVLQDLVHWIEVMRGCLADSWPHRLRQRARYTIAVAELRGRGSLDPALKVVTEFFTSLDVNEDRAVDLLDAAVLAVYCWGAHMHRATTLDLATILAWSQDVERRIVEARQKTSRSGETCTLLEARAMLLGPLSKAENPDEKVDEALSAWGEVLAQAKKTAQFPVSHIADLIDHIAPLAGDRPSFRSLCDQIDALTEERTGRHTVAARSYRRAMSQIEADNRLAAIDELQKAKVGWFSGDEMHKSVQAMLLLARAYSDLGLHIAARYYAAGACLIASTSDEDDVQELLPRCFNALADSYLDAGEGLSFLGVFGRTIALEANLVPSEQFAESHVLDRGLFFAAVIWALVEVLAPELKPQTDAITSTWAVDQAELQGYLAGVTGQEGPWSGTSAAELEVGIQRDFGVSPFSDIGPRRSYSWMALGIRWTVECSADPSSKLAALEVVATLQIIQVEFAAFELLIIPTAITIAVETGAVKRPEVKEALEAGRDFAVAMPADPNTLADPNDGYKATLGVAAVILGHATALGHDEFQAVIEKAFEHGLAYRAFSVRPARELMEFADEQVGFDLAGLYSLKAVTLQQAFTPHEAKELAWPTTVGPGYSQAKAHEFLGNRYRRAFEIAGLSLRRILASEDIRPLLLDQRADGRLDWQILGVLLNFVCQYQIEAIYGPMRVELGPQYAARFDREELPEDAEFDLSLLTAEAIKERFPAFDGGCLNTWGLRPNRRALDPAGVRRLLDVRYRQAIDDIPHDDIFNVPVV